MRCLSLTQPWAWSMMHGPKLVENRTWPCPEHMIGVPFAMHASAKWDAHGYEFLLANNVLAPERGSHLYAKSAIIGMQTILRCLSRETYDLVDERVRREVLPIEQEVFFFGPFGFVMDHVQRRPITPIPIPGALGFFTLPDDIAKEVVRRAGEPHDTLPAPARAQQTMPWEPPGGLHRSVTRTPGRRGRR